MLVGYSMLVRAPIELYNALPIPVHIGLKSSHHKQGSWRVTVQPLQTCLLNQGGAFEDVQMFQLEPIGYAASPTMLIPYNAIHSRWLLTVYSCCQHHAYSIQHKCTREQPTIHCVPASIYRSCAILVVVQIVTASSSACWVPCG